MTDTSTNDAPVKRSLRYLRVSSKRQLDTDADFLADGNSIDTQRKEAQAKERAEGLVHLDEYLEPGNSAQTIAKRPVFQEMLKRIIEQRDVDCVVIYSRSRAFRNHTDAAIIKRQLAALGVRLVSVKDDFGEGIMADAMEAVLDVFNEVQVRLNGEDIKTKMANKARNGGTVTKTKVGYLNVKKLVDGHQVNTVVTDPELSRFIPMAFELFATGDYTAETLQVALTEAGLRMPATARWPVRPISVQRVYDLLRDRYYLGEILYDGVWHTNGRHEPLITAELFDRVQRVIDSHSGAGTRHRKHPHYLKGSIWCGRCKHRFTVQRAEGNGGVYFYFLCRGRQDGICSQSYVPVEAIEQAVEDHYRTAVTVSAEVRARIRESVTTASAKNFELSEQMKTTFARRLSELDRKESYLLDLASEEDWPKDKLREKIATIRSERREIARKLNEAEQRLATGQAIFLSALDLLEDPHALYARSGEQVRSLLNRAFFTRLWVEGEKVTGHELREPFDVLVGVDGPGPAPAFLATIALPSTADNSAATRNRGSLRVETASVSLTLTRPLSVTVGHGWSKRVMVELKGVEPLTSAMRMQRSTN